MQKHPYIRLGAAFALALLALGLSTIFLPSANVAAAQEEGGLTYHVEAENARLNRRVLGDVTDSVQGIPAQPVDSFVWDGVGSVVLESASATLDVDPAHNTGTLTAEWTDLDGNEWTLTQTAFAPPPHPTGLRVGPYASGTTLIMDDPVVSNVYLHGDTGTAAPVLPTIFNMLATWGPAQVTLNGEPFENPYDGPAPMWAAHTMTAAGVRNENGEVMNADQSDYFNIMEPGNGYTDYGDMEFHITFSDMPGAPDNPSFTTDNFPPPLSFFYHLTFEDVQLDIQQAD